ncbi:GlmM: phosphoglucosamine mutase [Desulfosarcina variabilis str. Montpellier]|uniref:phosphoglucosamine mutase n=1 Tax=Desulfosarcina variabilis TaxID=2300 RepID=UPI003AFA1B01
MGKLFGTDGIRGGANQYPLDCLTVANIGRAIALFFNQNQKNGAGRFLIGQDTRISGDMLVSALSAGICAMGSDVCLAGVIPTPAVAYLTKTMKFDAGIVISASHNPYFDNGIKLFKKDGVKLSDDMEKSIERLLADADSLCRQSEAIQRTGTIERITDAGDRYLQFLTDCLSGEQPLQGLKLVVDCSHGAASQIAPDFFKQLGAEVKALFCSPDGININDHCGSQHPETLAKTVKFEKANLGLAFDGDADRLIAVDEKGRVLTGDQIMAICANHLWAKGALANPVVVTTVMSNLGLGIALKKMGLQHIQAKVGDRYVMEEMVKTGAVMGGEDSGHMIFLNHHTTGDGMLAALMLIDAMRSSVKPLSELSKVMSVFPQCLINVDVKSKPPIDSVEALQKEIERVENHLGENGRVLVRYSGTQPQCRVMVEGPSDDETHTLCQQIAAVVEKALGKS